MQYLNDLLEKKNQNINSDFHIFIYKVSLGIRVWFYSLMDKIQI